MFSHLLSACLSVRLTNSHKKLVKIKIIEKVKLKSVNDVCSEQN